MITISITMTTIIITMTTISITITTISIIVITFNMVVADVLYAVNGPGFGNAVEGFTLDMEGNLLETWNPDNQVICYKVYTGIVQLKHYNTVCGKKYVHSKSIHLYIHFF